MVRPGCGWPLWLADRGGGGGGEHQATGNNGHVHVHTCKSITLGVQSI